MGTERDRALVAAIFCVSGTLRGVANWPFHGDLVGLGLIRHWNVLRSTISRSRFKFISRAGVEPFEFLWKLAFRVNDCSR